MDKLWEYHYGLLSEAEAAALKVRLEQEPDIAAAYEQIRHSAAQIAEAAKVVPSRPLVFSAPTDDEMQETDGEEKTNISPPPEVPEEITGKFSTVLESLPSSSVRLRPPVLAEKPHFEPFAHAPRKTKTAWNPFAGRFSPQYARLNRVLTISAIVLLVVTLTGFGLIRQTRSFITNNLLQIHVVAPNVLARQTQNTLSINVSDWRGLPRQVPVRVSLLGDSGEKIALYQEKTDSQGVLHLALENPENLPENALVEISAGEEKYALAIRRRIPVVDAPVESGMREMKGGEGVDFSALSQQSRINMAPFYSNTQNAVIFPSMQGQPTRERAGGMGGGMSLSPVDAAPLEMSLAELPDAEFSDAVESDTEKLECAGIFDTITTPSVAEDDHPCPSTGGEYSGVELILAQKEFDPTQPIQFQVRSSRPEQSLIASVSRRGTPLAQFALKTSPVPDTLTTMNVPENDSLFGLLHIALFDPATDPPKEIASGPVVRHGDRFLRIEKWNEKADESSVFPAAIRITDDRGTPVAAEVRFSWWQGDAPQAEAIPHPILFDNQRQFRMELESALSQRKPVFSEMLDFFTVTAILGGAAVSGVVIVLFFLRRLSGFTPLIFAIVTGITCILLGVSLMHDQPAFAPISVQEQTLAPGPASENTESVPISVTPETYRQWTAESDAQGICTINVAEVMSAAREGPSTLQVEAFAPDQREGFAIWELQ